MPDNSSRPAMEKAVAVPRQRQPLASFDQDKGHYQDEASRLTQPCFSSAHYRDFYGGRTVNIHLWRERIGIGVAIETPYDQARSRKSRRWWRFSDGLLRSTDGPMSR